MQQTKTLGWLTIFSAITCNRFDQYIDRTSERCDFLELDGCSAHGLNQTLPGLLVVKAFFLPPKFTRKLEQLDECIIAGTKIRNC